MSKVLQHLVSKNKRRIIINGFDLDLTYITDQIIAMGLPATGVSGIYRNPQGEVIRFLESFHGGAFRIYNLCKRPQDQYDPEKFGGSVVRGARLPPPPLLQRLSPCAWSPCHRKREAADRRSCAAQECFPFEDHGVPPLRVVDALAASVQAWLSVSSDRVVCIHCLAGKGRTGLMVCAAMMKMGIVKASREAMAFYGERRMKNKKGVTQTSQRRWCEYYEQTLTGKLVRLPAQPWPRPTHVIPPTPPPLPPHAHFSFDIPPTPLRASSRPIPSRLASPPLSLACRVEHAEPQDAHFMCDGGLPASGLLAAVWH